MLGSCLEHQTSHARSVGLDRFRIVVFVLVSLAALDRMGWCQESRDDRILTTSDKWRIATSYLESTAGRLAPVVVLLHKQDGNRSVWNDGLAERLNLNGYAVLTVDLRHHGESTGSNQNGRRKSGILLRADYTNMVAKDLEAVKKFIFDEHQQKKLNMRKMAIVAPEMSAVVALNFAAIDWRRKPYPDSPDPRKATPRGQDVRALVLLSPDAVVRGMTTQRAIAFLKRVPMSALVCVGAADPMDKGRAQRIFKGLGGTRKEGAGMYFESYDGIESRGTDLLPQSELRIVDFLDNHLKNLSGSDFDWRDRKNKLSLGY